MRHAPIRYLLVALLALCLTPALASRALAQVAPSCEITGPSTVAPDEPFTLCGIEGAGLTYSWYDASGPTLILLTHERCLDFPNGIPDVGTHDFEFVISQGEAFKKCPITITVRELPPPPEGHCWLTGGGEFFTDKSVRWFSYGGNVNPGCSPTAGDGGNWNTVDHVNDLHFQGKHIEVIRCGNVEGIPPGSTSPVTPFNFIEFKGTGTLKGVKGNKTNYDLVYFWAHYEDRGEPGTNDRIFLNVYTDPNDPAGSSKLVIDGDNNAATMDPVTVENGNLQLHDSGCDKYYPAVQTRLELGRPSVDIPTELSLSARPNPSLGSSMSISFAVPRSTNVAVHVFDVAGRQVRELAAGWASAGTHTLQWDLRNSAGQRVSKGVYFVRMKVDNVVQSRTISVR